MLLGPSGSKPTLHVHPAEVATVNSPLYFRLCVVRCMPQLMQPASHFHPGCRTAHSSVCADCDAGTGAPDAGYSCQACPAGFKTDPASGPPLAKCVNPAACSPACANGGKCIGINVCDCTGTGYTGATCTSAGEVALVGRVGHSPQGQTKAYRGEQKAGIQGYMFGGRGTLFYHAHALTRTDCCATYPCPFPASCPNACANGGKCDDATKKCNCIGTGFTGATCTTPRECRNWAGLVSCLRPTNSSVARRQAICLAHATHIRFGNQPCCVIIVAGGMGSTPDSALRQEGTLLPDSPPIADLPTPQPTSVTNPTRPPPNPHPCYNPVTCSPACKNGGICGESGVCSCPTGFAGSSCAVHTTGGSGALPAPPRASMHTLVFMPIAPSSKSGGLHWEPGQ
jgi:hypothetical protein